MKSPMTQTKPFPWKCGECGANGVAPAAVNYTAEIHHDGELHQVVLPDLKTPRCSACGTIVLDDAANRQISAALRKQFGILRPDEIQAAREALGLTRQQLADQLGVGEATLARWEDGGQIQQRAHDNLLRLFFELPAVRATLSGKGERAVEVEREFRVVTLD
jgi:putative zinc finger/helix-turn-helix YgiT family protein